MNPVAHNPKDFWTGVIYVTIGAGALFMSRDYSMGNAVKMGPAYFPVVLSVVLIVIGIISLIRSLVRQGTQLGTVAWKGLALIVSSTVLFGLVVRGAGLAIALPLLIMISSLASIRFNWRHSLALAVGVTVFCILVFYKGLGVPLPAFGAWFGR